jgi:hypothetical protein
MRGREVGMVSPPANPVKIFYSYAQQDKELLRELETHMSMLYRQRFIVGRRQIDTRTDWRHSIDQDLEPE